MVNAARHHANLPVSSNLWLFKKYTQMYHAGWDKY